MLDILKDIALHTKYHACEFTYPPEIFWEKNITIDEILHAWKTAPQKGNIGLSIHIPYCLSHCFYCTHKTQAATNPKILDEYLDLLEQEAKLFGSYINAPIHSLYIGGGTPTLLTPEQLRRLYEILSAHFDLGQIVEHMAEGSPRTITNEKIAIMKGYGMDKFTFGVQTLNNAILKKYNRVQDEKDVQNAVTILKTHGIDYINIDIMAGLPGQTVEDFRKTLDQIAKLQTHHVCLNVFFPTKYTPYAKAGNILSSEDLTSRNEMIRLWQDSDLNKQNDPRELYTFHSINDSHLGLGYGASNHIFGELYYTKTSFDDYKNWLQNNTSTQFLGKKITLDTEIGGYIVENLRSGLHSDDFLQKFGTSITETRFFPIIRALQDKGLVSAENTKNNTLWLFTNSSDYQFQICTGLFYYPEWIKKYLNSEAYKSSRKNTSLTLETFFKDSISST